ncbi:MAG: hypothetical protein MZV65_49220 [Chromatiales bacterium]|nr:hypothetical protein [Chromatiales bacterium]
MLSGRIGEEAGDGLRHDRRGQAARARPSRRSTLEQRRRQPLRRARRCRRATSSAGSTASCTRAALLGERAPIEHYDVVDRGSR